MGLKTKNLDLLVKDNLNVFEYKEIDNIDDLKKYIKDNNKFTIRFDREYNIQGLPFYIYNDKLNIEEIINEMNKLNCTLLCSNGYIYDNDLLFNFVIEVDKNNNFILELCDKKVPLRKMYEYKTTTIKGNLFEDTREYINKNDNKYTKRDIESIIELIINRDLKYKYLEGTIYNKKVGLLNDTIIIWQTN